ncbi:MAG: response regulator transcription factor [Bacteroidota bacterium]|jgi:DNA-binding NarL/FixJ family response regulator
MIRVLIADDHVVVREGLKHIISKASDMTVSAEAINGQEVIDRVREQTFDVVVLDINMPGRGGFEILKELKRDYARLPVLVLSVHPEDQVGVRVLKAGASGYLNKESTPKELVNAIRKVYTGGKFITPSLAEKLAYGLEVDVKALAHESLSDREYQVFLMLAAGKAANEIAQELALSVKTVRTYRQRILEKLTMKNDVELSHYAIEHKLIESSRS